MDKIIYQDSCEELLASVKRNGEAMVRLIETDTGIKSAASDMIDRSLLEEYRPTDKNDVLIHLIAMGNSDQYGFNKNGDWFSGEALEKRANTFVTHGHVFVEHNNRDPKVAIGSIKHASYDPKGMQRVELLIHLNRDKDPEGYEMAKKGSDLNFSMSCRVPNDRCSCCGNEAKVVSKYCDHLKRGMGKYYDEFNKYAFAYNDEPTFFDISRVKNPADRIARHLEYLFDDAETVKSASADGSFIIPSAIAAQLDGVHLGTLELDEQLVLSKLASAEAYIDDVSNHQKFYTDSRANACYGSYPFAMLEKFAKEELEECKKVKPETLFRELGKKMCMLSLQAFAQLVTGEDDSCSSPVCEKAALMLPGAFRDMMEFPSGKTELMNMFRMGSEFGSSMDPGCDGLIRNFMDSAEDKFSLKSGPVKGRIIAVINKSASSDNVIEKMQKAASNDVSDEQAASLANVYAQYQVRALCDMRDLHGSFAVDDTMYDLIAGANSVLVHDR